MVQTSFEPTPATPSPSYKTFIPPGATYRKFQMTSPLAAPPLSINNPESQSPGGPLWSNRYRPIIAHCIIFAVVTIPTILIIIYLLIPALISPEFRLNSDSSVSNLTARWNISLSIKNPSQVIHVQYNHMKLFLKLGPLPLAGPHLVPSFTQPPSNVTTVRAEVLSTLRSLKGESVVIDVVVKSKRRLHLGLWWVPVFDVYVSYMGVTFTAPTDGDGDWPVLGGTPGCIPDMITQL